MNCTNCGVSKERCDYRRQRIGGKLGFCCPTCRDKTYLDKWPVTTHGETK